LGASKLRGAATCPSGGEEEIEGEIESEIEEEIAREDEGGAGVESGRK